MLEYPPEQLWPLYEKLAEELKESLRSLSSEEIISPKEAPEVISKAAPPKKKRGGQGYLSRAD